MKLAGRSVEDQCRVVQRYYGHTTTEENGRAA